MYRFLKKIIYPSCKVNQQYIYYIGWYTSSTFIGSIQYVLAIDSMLYSNTQEKNCTTLSFNYIGKDILGQIGSLIYISGMGNIIDSKTKTSFAYSITLEQSAIFLETMTPFLPISLFLPLAGIANINKNISFTGLGAINTKAILKIISTNENIGEVYAKITLLNTLSSTIGMSFGLYLTFLFPNIESKLCINIILSYLRIFTINKAFKSCNLFKG